MIHAATKAEGPNPSSDLRLLIVEDSVEDASLVARAVARQWPGLDWRRVETREELEAALAEPWDAIVADDTPPRFGALAALDLVRRLEWDGPFIVVSAVADEEATVTAMRAGAHDYVVKGDLHRLAPALERELEEARVRTQSREAQHRLAVAERRYRRVLRQLPGLVWTTDVDLRITSSGGGGWDLASGLRQDQLVGATVDELGATIDLFDPAQHRRALGNRHVHFDASANGRDYLVSLEAFLTKDGRVEGCIGIALDVTERHAVEDALRESESRFRALIENSLDVTTILLADGSVRYASPSTERVLGYRPAEMVGRNAFELVHPDDLEGLAELFRDAASTPASSTTEAFRYLHADGTWRLMEAVGLNLLDDPAVGGMVITARDITERRALEERLNQSARLEAIGQLAGGIAHDFNNVLLVVRGYGTVLRAALTDPQQIADVDEIVTAADRAANLTRQLLAFGRRQVLQPRVLCIREVVHDLESLLRQAASERLDLALELDEDTPAVLADPTQIEQVLINLVVNARDATPAGGTITVGTGRATLEAPDDSVTPPLAAGSYATLTVRDTGSGITEEVLPHVFEPFFTTKDEGVGTGLGLSTVYGIAAQAGGSIGVRSVPGEGTEITILLPAADGAGSVGPDGRGRPEEIPHGSELVLLVEDEEPVRELVQRVLEDAGYRVHASALPSEALAEIDAGVGIDLLISDVVMPEMSGYELAARIRLEYPSVRTLFISGYARDAAGSADFSDGADVLLQKPFTPGQLALAVRDVLDRPEGAA